MYRWPPVAGAPSAAEVAAAAAVVHDAGGWAGTGFTAQELAAASASAFPALAAASNLQYASAFGAAPAARYLYAPATSSVATGTAAAVFQQHFAYQQQQQQRQQQAVVMKAHHDQQILIHAHQQIQQQQQQQNRDVAKMRQSDVIEIDDSDEDELGKDDDEDDHDDADDVEDAAAEPECPSVDGKMPPSQAIRKSSEDSTTVKNSLPVASFQIDKNIMSNSSSSGKKKYQKKGKLNKLSSLDSSSSSKRDSIGSKQFEMVNSTDVSAKKKRGRPRKNPDASLGGPSSSQSKAASKASPAITAEPSSSPGKKKIKTVVKGALKPLVVVQNWSREGLMEELATKERDRRQTILDSILLHATGYSTNNPPPATPLGQPFIPNSIHLNKNQISQLTEALVKNQAMTLQHAVNSAFYKCAAYVDDMRSDKDQRSYATPASTTTAPGGQPIATTVPTHQRHQPVLGGGGEATAGPVYAPNPMIPPGHVVALVPLASPTTTTTTTTAAGGNVTTSGKPPGVMMEKHVPNDVTQKAFEAQQQIVKYQHDELIKARHRVAELMEERKHILETFKKEQTYLKEQVARSKTIHARSAHAFMKASVTSLRWLRERANGSDEEDDDQGGDYFDDAAEDEVQ
jgi:hypothetical protein